MEEEKGEDRHTCCKEEEVRAMPRGLLVVGRDSPSAESIKGEKSKGGEEEEEEEEVVIDDDDEDGDRIEEEEEEVEENNNNRVDLAANIASAYAAR